MYRFAVCNVTWILFFLGENLISNGHYAEHEIQARLDGLDSLWKQLQDSSLLKKERLHDAYQVQYRPFNIELILFVSTLLSTMLNHNYLNSWEYPNA